MTERSDADETLDDALTSVNALSHMIGQSDMRRPHVETILNKIPIEMLERVKRRRTESPFGNDPPTEKSLIRLHRQVRTPYVVLEKHLIISITGHSGPPNSSQGRGSVDRPCEQGLRAGGREQEHDQQRARVQTHPLEDASILAGKDSLQSHSRMVLEVSVITANAEACRRSLCHNVCHHCLVRGEIEFKK